MSSNRIRKRLEQLERDATDQLRRDLELHLSSQKELCCPLPEQTTPEESGKAFELLKAGQAAIKIDKADQRLLGVFRDYAIRLHRKYGGPFAGEELST